MNLFTFVKDKVVDVKSMLLENKRGTVIYLNPATYNYFRKNIDLIENVDGIRFDGIFMTSFLKLFGVPIVERQSFDMTSLAPIVFNKAQQEKLSIYLCGGTMDDIKNFCSIINQRYPFINIVGFRDGYFNMNEFSDVSRDIIKLQPDIVILGLGGKKQEVFASELSLYLDSYIFTCGAFITQTTERINFYPVYIDRFNLRWAYRFIVEPRTIKRVLIQYPLFIFNITFDVINHYLKR